MNSFKAMDFHLWVWKVCGVWHEPGQPRWYFAYSIFINVVFFYIFPFCIAMELFFTDTMKELIDIILFLPTSLVALKSALIVINRSKLRRLFGLLAEMDKMVQNEEQLELIRKAFKVSKRLVVFFSSEFYVSIAAHFAVAVMTEGRVMMWASWYPVDYKNIKVLYVGLLGYQLICTLFCAYLTASMDVYGLALYRLLGAHLDILGIQLSQLGRSPDGKALLKKNRKIRCEEDLKKCIVYHNLCIR